MKIKFEGELEEAVRFSLDIDKPVNEYAMSLLVIINNAREYPHEFYKVENTSSNAVLVTCSKESQESVKDFLEWHGKITRTEKVYVCKPEAALQPYEENRLSNLYYDDESIADIVMLEPELDF